MVTKSVLVVAYEVWETRLGSALLEKMKIEDPSLRTTLLVADPFQVSNLQAAAKLRTLKKQANHDTKEIFEDLVDWQGEIRKATVKDVQRSVEEFTSETGIKSFSRLVQSDIHLNPLERRPYYSKMKTHQAEYAAVLALRNARKMLESAAPDLVVMVNEQYLIKNFIAELCEIASIPLRIFRGLRFEDYLKVDDYFLGTSQFYDSKAVSRPQQPRITLGPGQSLYRQNMASESKAFLSNCRSRPLATSLWTIRESVREIFEFKSSNLRKHNGRLVSLKYWEANPTLSRILSAKILVRKLVYVFSRNRYHSLHDLPLNYLLIPLHYRPESSTLTYGAGVEDEDVIRKVLSTLESSPGDFVLAVLENPAMIGLRPLKFYRELRRLHRVVLIDPAEPTHQLIAGAHGVLTVSGTAALEASLMEKPVHVSGRPEYLEAVLNTEIETIPEFVQTCISGVAPNSKLGVSDYLEREARRGRRLTLDWQSAKPHNVRATVEVLFDMLTESLRDRPA